MKIKKNDSVIVLAGKDKGKTGKVVKSMPKVNKVVVSGINIVKKNQRPTRNGQKGQIVEKTLPIDASNVALESEYKKSKKK